MNWYYRKTGSSQKKGIVTREQLELMIESGEVESGDLLFSEVTGQKWVHAGSITDLFPPKQIEQETAPLPAVEPAPVVIPPPVVKKTPFFGIIALAAAAVFLGILLISTRNGANVETQPETDTSTEPVPVEEEIDPWITLESDIADLLRNSDIRQADALLNRYISERGADELSTGLIKQLNLRKDQEEFRKLYALFLTNKAGDSQIRAMVNLAAKIGESDRFAGTLRSKLNSAAPATAADFISILAAARILKDNQLQLAAVEKIGTSLDCKSSISNCFYLAKLYNEYNLPEKATAVIEEYTQTNPESAAAWLELAAQQSARNNVDESLAALKKAVRIGGDPFRESAKKDPRFDNVRDTWTFRRNTR